MLPVIKRMRNSLTLVDTKNSSSPRKAVFLAPSLMLFVLSLITGNYIFVLLLAAIFPLAPLIDIRAKNFMCSVPVTIALNALVVIVTLSFFSLLRVPINITSFSVVTFFYVAASSMLGARLKRKLFTSILENCNNLSVAPIYVLTLFAFFSRTGSVITDPVPLVHDPMVHSFWAKRIIEEAGINYFYSPGLHIWIALVSQLGDLSLPRVTNIITNTLSSLSVLYWGLAAYITSKSKTAAAATALLILVAPIPTNLFYIAGKNSAIAAIPFIGLLLILCVSLIRDKKYSSSMAVLLTLCGIGTIHYPMYIFAFGASILLLLLTALTAYSQGITNGWRKLLVLFAMPLTLSAIFIGTLAYTTSTRDTAFPVLTSNKVSQAFHDSATEGTIDENILSNENQNRSSKLGIRSPATAAWGLLPGFFGYIEKQGGKLGVILMTLVLVALYYVSGAYWKGKSQKNVQQFTYAISPLVSLLLIVLAAKVIRHEQMTLVVDTGYILLFAASSLSIGLLFIRINNFRYLLIVSVIIFAGSMSAFATYEKFQARTRASYVNENDLAAYEWINANTSDEEGFIGLSKISPDRQKIVYSIDGTLWLPVFTGNKIATPSHELRFVSAESHINYAHLQNLIDDGSRESLEYFLGNNFNYLYVDGVNAYNQLRIDNLIGMGLVELAYENKEVKIYRLSE